MFNFAVEAIVKFHLMKSKISLKKFNFKQMHVKLMQQSVVNLSKSFSF